MKKPSDSEVSTEVAVDAVRRGYQPIPIPSGQKRPRISAWTHVRWDSENEVREKFEKWAEEGQTNVGLLLGEPSGGLVDVDLDHPKTMRLKDYLLPPTPMRTGRPGRPTSHYWYRVRGTLPSTRRYKMPDGSVSVELRSNKAQTIIPPSVHPSGENYRWEGEPWGGEQGPALIDGRRLEAQVATLGLATVLLEKWPKKGGRHEAYLALAGGLLRHGEGVHPYWERNLPVLIGALVDATQDEDGEEARVSEVMSTTVERLRSGGKVAGFGRLADILGTEHVDQVRVLRRNVESAVGHVEEPPAPSEHQPTIEEALEDEDPEHVEDEEERPWQPVDLDPYLTGEIEPPEASALRRSDGEALMYQGRVNMLYGASETAKSWIAAWACMQEMAKGERALYIDFEDEPGNTLSRLTLLGAGVDDIRTQFIYLNPDEPVAPMQRNRWGKAEATDTGRLNYADLLHTLEQVDPSIVVADGMTTLFSLHGLDSNGGIDTDTISTWLKSMTRKGRTTVIVVDHSTKNPQKGTLPTGSQHKEAMVQGTLLQAFPVKQPRRGAMGEIELYVIKDRPGSVREIADEQGDKVQLAARVYLDSREPGRTEMRIESPPAPPNKSQGELDIDMSASREADRAEKKREEERKRREKVAREEAAEQRVVQVFGAVGTAMSIPEILGERAEWTRQKLVPVLKRMVDHQMIEPAGETESSGRGRPAKLYVLVRTERREKVDDGEV